ncbi:hypothetical protein B0H14DRAFT_2602799 [Mycena olivaceomarginata]|nr:hypothetical protein B0H14DRAFT_2602799 [Mycena olivaceomarginata]
MGYVTLYGPRQHPEEPVYAEQDPIHTYFRQQADRRLSRTQFKGFINELVFILQSPQYEQKWLTGADNNKLGQLLPRHCHFDAGTLYETVRQSTVGQQPFQTLTPIRMIHLWYSWKKHRTMPYRARYMFDKSPQFLERCIPRKINVMDASEDFSDDDDNTSDYNDEYEDVKVRDPKNREEDKSEQGRKRRRTCEQNRLSGPKRAPTTRMNSRNKRDWNIELEDKGVLEYVVEKWVSDLDLHFGWVPRRGRGERPRRRGGTTTDERGCSPHLRTGSIQTGCARTLSHYTVLNSQPRQENQTTGLTLIFETLCDASNDCEIDPDLATSYRLYQWRNQINVIWNRWTPQHAYNETEWNHVATHDNSETFQEKMSGTGGPSQVALFLRTLANNVWMIPKATSPMLAVFFLASQRNFLQAWEIWLGPCVQRAGIQTEDWDIGRVYRDLAGIRCLDIPKFASNNQVTIPTELMQLMQLNEDYQRANPSLPKGTIGKDRQKQFNARRNAQKPDIPFSTPPSASSTSGSTVSGPVTAGTSTSGCTPSTPVPLKDKSGPVPVGTSTSGCTPSTPVPFKDNTQATARLRTDCPTCKNYVLPEDKCVRIWEVDKLEVRGLRGCVITCADPDDRLEPKAWKVHGAKKTADTLWKTPEELGLKELVPRDTPHIVEGCKRDITILVDRKTQTQVGCVIFGAVTGEDLEKLKKTNESLVNGYGLKRSAEQQKWAYGKMTAYGSRIPKGGRRGDTYRAYTHISADTDNDIHTLFDLAKANHRYNQGHCRNRRPRRRQSHAHEHRAGSDGDNNVQLELAYSIPKNCRSDEFNFSYTEWGILVKTVPGCIWVFNARDMHQVTLPRRSSLQAANGNPMSSGSHITVSTANANKARAILRARRLHRTTAEYWRNEFRQ